MQATWWKTGPVVAFPASPALRARLDRASTGDAQARRRRAQAAQVLMGRTTSRPAFAPFANASLDLAVVPQRGRMRAA